MKRTTIDLNGDVGEGSPQEEALIPLLSSVNIACGGHAGDERSMTEAVQRAMRAGAALGAHPSFPDREHFGRREMDAAPRQVQRWTREQIVALKTIVQVFGMRLHHVKPHGGLYNLAVRDRSLADAIAETVMILDPALRLVALAGSQLAAAGRRFGLRVVAEGFVDRSYLADGRLTPRATPGAVLEDELQAIEQGLRLARGEPISAFGGGTLCPRVDTLCLHGDGPTAVVFAKRLRDRLEAEGIVVRPVSN